ncbi:RepB family protein, partial [Escherichia coli]
MSQTENAVTSSSGTKRAYRKGNPLTLAERQQASLARKRATHKVNRPGFPGECFICELRLPDHRFRWKHNKLFL